MIGAIQRSGSAGRVGHVLLLGDRAQPGALGHDGPQAGVVRGGLQQQLAADGQAEAADAAALRRRGGRAGSATAARRSGSPPQPRALKSPSLSPSPRRSSSRTP